MARGTTEERVRETFAKDTAEHELEVIRDDGLYRHLRFKRPDTICFSYDLVTWPGYLAFVGDMGDYVFSRIDDMFKFFEGEPGRINPHYWAQKLKAPRGTGSDASREYSEEAFRASLLEWLGVNKEGTLDSVFDLAENEHVYPSLLAEAIDREIFDYWDRPADEHQAREVIQRLEDEGYFHDAWEMSLRDYDTQYLWCCFAIVRGIEMYRAATREAVPA